jgi:hypothetical protein
VLCSTQLHSTCAESDDGEEIGRDYVCGRCVSKDPALKKNFKSDDDMTLLCAAYFSAIVECGKIRREHEDVKKLRQEMIRQFLEKEVREKNLFTCQRTSAVSSNSSALDASSSDSSGQVDQWSRQFDETVPKLTPSTSNPETQQHQRQRYRQQTRSNGSSSTGSRSTGSRRSSIDRSSSTCSRSVGRLAKLDAKECAPVPGVVANGGEYVVEPSNVISQ